MVKLTKIYTRNGDNGHTQLAGGHPISKSSDHIVAIGDVDELNAWIGLCESITQSDNISTVTRHFSTIQQQLFNLGAELAVSAEDRRLDTPSIKEADIQILEKQIDDMNMQLTSLTSFILPGGHIDLAHIHICRTVCRRAERQVIKLYHQIALNPLLIQYLNRLSDWLFVFARFWAQQQEIQERLWLPE